MDFFVHIYCSGGTCKKMPSSIGGHSKRCRSIALQYKLGWVDFVSDVRNTVNDASKNNQLLANMQQICSKKLGNKYMYSSLKKPSDKPFTFFIYTTNRPTAIRYEYTVIAYQILFLNIHRFTF